MGLQERFAEIRAGFHPSFWVANFTELFERLAYYGTSAVLAIYLHEQLRFSQELTGWLIGTFGFVVWFLPVLGGTLADRFGFRRALLFAYLVMSIGYFLLGSLSAPWMQTVRQAVGDKWLVLAILMIPALGPAVVKPCVAGTTARASAEAVRSLGYSLYYTIVNVGGTLGPVVAWVVRKQLGWGVENVFRVCSLSVFLMFWFTLFFFHEAPAEGREKVASIPAALRNVVLVLGNFRFLLFLLIFSGYWVVFWQQYIAAPLFVRGYISPNADVDLLLSADAATVICFQLLVSYLTRRIRTIPAITLGILISSLSWVILAVHPTSPMLAGAAESVFRLFGRSVHIEPVAPMLVLAFFVLALGEITQSPRYYEYVSRLAPPGREGLFMGYAFLPIAIGYFVAGVLGGSLLHYFGEVLHRPQQMWWVVSGVGVATTLLMVCYDRLLKPVAPARGAGSTNA
ncbi:MAG TPA: MFS transporter [Candidatus Acidoferrales bacterium]|nr:MFS transporter [Candidatus Acidoferrales bacterium]